MPEESQASEQAFQAPEAAADLHRFILEQASDAVIFTTLDGIIHLWNFGAEEIFGFPSEEAVGKSVEIIVPEHLREPHWAGFHRAIKTGRTKYARVALTVPANHKTRKTLYIDLTFTIVKNREGSPIGVQASARDVTERYLAERALREGAFALGFLSLDLDWKVTYINQQAKNIFGKETLEGRILWDEFPELIGSVLYEKIYMAMAEQKGIHFETFVPPLNTWVEAHAYPSPAGVALYLRNINQAKYMEERLGKSEEMLNLLVSQARDYAIIMYDPNGIIQSWNTGAERLYGFRREEVVGKHASILAPQSPFEKEWPTREVRIAIERGSFETEEERIRKDGSRFRASVVITALRDANGKLRGFSVVVRDITERHEAEKERERLLEETRQAVSSRDELLSIASHEIKTPLTALGLQLQLLQRAAENQEGISPPMRKMIGSCERQSRRLASLLDELLNVTRIRLGKADLHLQETDLSSLVGEAVERFSADAENAGSTVTARLAPAVVGRWDAGRLEEVVNNLLSNAIKYGNGKPIEVRTEVAREEGVARIVVADQGLGIPADMQDKIFSRFERVETGKKIKGVGLGLYIVRQLVNAHGGRIWVKSELGKGSVFTVELPLHPREIEAPVQESA